MAEITMESAKQIFDEYNTAILAGDTDKALTFRGKEQKDSIVEAFSTPEGKAETLQMLQMMTPLSYVMDHIDQKDGKAIIYTTATFKNPETPDKKLVQEILLVFINEGGTWKLGNINFMIDLDSIKKSPDQNFEPQDNYDLDKNTSIGGRIISVKFETDYTLVIIRMLDEEDLIFLPAKAELEKAGLKTADLVPYKVLSASGSPHKSNTFKYFCSQAEIMEPSMDF